MTDQEVIAQADLLIEKLMHVLDYQEEFVDDLILGLRKLKEGRHGAAFKRWKRALLKNTTGIEGGGWATGEARLAAILIETWLIKKLETRP